MKIFNTIISSFKNTKLLIVVFFILKVKFKNTKRQKIN